jgi:hypothetical protein
VTKTELMNKKRSSVSNKAIWPCSLQDFSAQSYTWLAVILGTAKGSFCAKKRDALNIVFFLIVLMIYIQVLKVKFLKDVCFILLISLKSTVGMKCRSGQCVPHSQLIKRKKEASSEDRMSRETHQL